ncbi:response regulator [Pseudarthrobacter sp. BRE9]|uniref:hybrid sensor histidine kinase/response regulator n=1 Tax=Pseudarthrobacter sp. BRE9 TaxID=2962582 RepID=UPI00288ACFE2|nr:response regulator [Pseudarthrobacter sp. BRE9]
MTKNRIVVVGELVVRGPAEEPGRVLRVLVVDDDAGSLLVARAAVEQSGHECITAADGDTAWELYRSHQPHVVVADLQMPGMDGLSLCRAIRTADTDNYTYLVLVTSHGSRNDVLAGMDAGADDYVTKPLDPFHLQTRLFAAQRVTTLHSHLADALAAARSSNERLADFTGRVSHDLRTPLTSIIGYVELGSMDPDPDPAEVAEYLQIAGSSARRMLSMVEELLAFASIGGSLERKELALADLVEAVRVDMSAGLRASGAFLTCEDLVFVADEAQMRMALQNLINNALAYSRPGVPPVIRVEGHHSEAGTIVRVVDNGKGISVGDRARVVEPLVRLHRDGDPTGSGLGLATCSRIAAAHGGRLEITGNPGQGTTVSLFLAQA